MAAPTTWRGEYDRADVALNRRDFLPLAGTLAGTSPRNPIQAGLGIRMRVRVSGIDTAALSSVVGKMIYMLDETEATASTFTLTQSATDPQVYEAEGAAGGARLGFPANLNYDDPVPFELELSVVFRGGNLKRRYGFWIANKEHGRCEPCEQRETFGALYKNCCFNGRGFRANSAIPGVGGSTVNLWGVFGEWDAFFSAARGADFAGWAVGIDSFSANGALELVCSLDRDLDNPYLPDSITGAARNLPDDPFVNPTTALPTAGVAAQLSNYGRLDPAVDGTEDEIGETNFPVEAGAPADITGTAFSDPPAYMRLSPVMIGGEPPIRPDARAQDRTGQGGSPGGIRSLLSVVWVDANNNPIATPNEVSLSSFAVGSEPRLQFTMSGFDPGDTILLFVSPLLPDFYGPGVPPAAAPLGVSTVFAAQPWILEPRTSPVASNRDLLITSLGIDSRTVPNTLLAPYAITGGTTWSASSVGGTVNFGAAAAGPQSFTFTVTADTTYLANVLSALGAAGVSLLAGVDLWLQGIVYPSGSVPLPTNGLNGTVANLRFFVDPVHGSHLTTVANIRVRV